MLGFWQGRRMLRMLPIDLSVFSHYWFPVPSVLGTNIQNGFIYFSDNTFPPRILLFQKQNWDLNCNRICGHYSLQQFYISGPFGDAVSSGGNISKILSSFLLLVVFWVTWFSGQPFWCLFLKNQLLLWICLWGGTLWRYWHVRCIVKPIPRINFLSAFPIGPCLPLFYWDHNSIDWKY